MMYLASDVVYIFPRYSSCVEYELLKFDGILGTVTGRFGKILHEKKRLPFSSWYFFKTFLSTLPTDAFRISISYHVLVLHRQIRREQPDECIFEPNVCAVKTSRYGCEGMIPAPLTLA